MWRENHDAPSYILSLVFDHLFRIIWKKLFASKCKNVNRSIEWRISIMELTSFIINSSISSILYSGYNTWWTVVRWMCLFNNIMTMTWLLWEHKVSIAASRLLRCQVTLLWWGSSYWLITAQGKSPTHQAWSPNSERTDRLIFLVT